MNLVGLVFVWGLLSPVLSHPGPPHLPKSRDELLFSIYNSQLALEEIQENQEESKASMNILREAVAELLRQQARNTEHLGMIIEQKTEDVLRKLSPRDCEEVIQLRGGTKGGVYQIFPEHSGEGVSVWCHVEEVEEGQGVEAWTTLLRRQRQTLQLNFNRTWQEYKSFFGDPAKEYWIGNEWIHALTGGSSSDQYQVRVMAKDFAGEERQGYYGTFSVGDEASKYLLSVGNYDESRSSLNNFLLRSNARKFSALDQNYDAYGGGVHHCGLHYGGFWYKHCGAYSPTAPMAVTERGIQALVWYSFDPSRPDHRRLSALTMMVKRRA